METPKKTPPAESTDKAMEGRQITKDGTDHKDQKFHEVDMGVDEELALENLRGLFKERKIATKYPMPSVTAWGFSVSRTTLHVSSSGRISSALPRKPMSASMSESSRFTLITIRPRSV
jgi:hypothetical protein